MLQGPPALEELVVLKEYDTRNGREQLVRVNSADGLVFKRKVLTLPSTLCALDPVDFQQRWACCCAHALPCLRVIVRPPLRVARLAHISRNLRSDARVSCCTLKPKP